MLSKDLLFAMNDVDDRYLESTRRAMGLGDESKTVGNVRRFSRIILLAALISALMIGSAYAAGLFSLQERHPAGADETYTIHYSESPSGELTWTDMEYIFRFGGVEQVPGRAI